MTLFTIRTLLWLHKKNLQGTYPLMIAVTVKRKVTYVKTAFRLKANQFKDGFIVNYTNSQIANKSLRDQLAEVEEKLLLADPSVNIKSLLKDGSGADFYKFVDKIKKGAAGTIVNYNKEVNRLKDYRDPLLISSIDPSFLRNYERSERDRGMSQNTINQTFKWLRMVMNQAEREGLIKSTPFKAFKVPKYHQPERIFLTAEEREKWFNFWKLKKVDGSLYITLSWFMFSLFTGLRHSDLVNFDASKRIEGELIRLRAVKNKQWVVLPIGKSLSEVVSVIKDLPRPFSGDKSREHLKIISGIMEFKKNVTCHTFRHSFGAMCAELKIPKSVTAELMGITDDTVNVYYHLTFQNIADQAAPLKLI